MHSLKWLLLVIVLFSHSLLRSASGSDSTVHKGFLMGIAFGAGQLYHQTMSASKKEGILSIPNFKIGYWINRRTSIHFLMPGAVYNLKGTDRIFEAFQVGASRWLTPRWWVLGATGLTFDAGAFYTVDKLTQLKVNTGLPSISIGTGYELWTHKKLGLDVQYRFFYGRSNLDGGDLRTGQAHVVLLGFNLY